MKNHIFYKKGVRGKEGIKMGYIKFIFDVIELILSLIIVITVLQYPFIDRSQNFLIFSIGSCINLAFNSRILQFCLILYVFINLEIDWKKTIKYEQYRRLEKKYRNIPLHKIPYKHRILSIFRKKVKEDGMALEFVLDKYKDLSICKVAVENNRDARKFIPKELLEKID